VERVTPPDQRVTAVDIHPTGPRIAYGTGDGAIFVLTPDGQVQLIHTLATEQGEKPTIGSLSWSPNREWLAFTASYQDNDIDSAAGGLWLLGLADETVIQLLGSHHIEAGDSDVSVYREIIDADYSPDGSALLLQASYWEYVDTLWMLPLGADPAENNLYDPDGLWRDGSWSADGRSVLLSGWTHDLYSDLASVESESGMLTRLIDGETAGLIISLAQELPEGIVFVGTGTDPDNGTPRSRLYLGDQAAGGFTFAAIGPDRDLCSGGFVTGVEWDPSGLQAVVSCNSGAELISLDGSVDVDLSRFLEPIPGDNLLKVIWNSG
jgi:WD40 repeat protein